MTNLPVTAQELKAAIEAGKSEAFEAYQKGEIVDGCTCGFAWLNVYDADYKTIRSNGKLGKLLEEVGFDFDKDYPRIRKLWNPSKLPIQSVNGLEKGAHIVLKHVKPLLDELGLVCTVGSRLD